MKKVIHPYGQVKFDCHFYKCSAPSLFVATLLRCGLRCLVPTLLIHLIKTVLVLRTFGLALIPFLQTETVRCTCCSDVYTHGASLNLRRKVMLIQSIFILFFFFHATPSSAQSSLDSLIQLNEVTVKAARYQKNDAGNQSISIDSTATFLLKNTNLAGVLSLNTSIFIKNYGPGRLATTSLRGGSASHTAVVWNGFNLENNMLGQTDFALIPSLFTDDISIQYGNTSAKWGSGAVGGAILLGSQQVKQKGWQFQLHSKLGSFEHFNNGIVLKYGGQRFESVSKVFTEQAKNDFPVQRRDGTTYRLPHSQLKQAGFLQENYFHINAKQQLGVHLWYQNVDRELPPHLAQTFSEAEQKDSIRRVTLDWKYIDDAFKLTAKSGFFIEKLTYEDANSDNSSISDSRKFINEIAAFYQYNEQHQFSFGVNHSFLQARSTGYGGVVEQTRLALFAAHHWSSSNSKWLSSLNIRQEWADGEAIPFIVSGGLEYALHPQWQWTVNIARSYRLPTFNDLYWEQGGNPDLVDESGWSETMGLQYQRDFSNNKIDANLNLYNRHIDNWIVWVPLGAYYSPQNLSKVWSRGLENTWTWKWRKGAWSGQYQMQYNLTYSTNQRAKSASDRTVGKQLIYVPRNQGRLSWQLQYKTWQWSNIHTFQGKTYTLGDNTETLSGFYLSHFHVSKSFKFSEVSTHFSFKINNIWNKNYQVIVSYPMPGRHFELGGKVFF